MNLKATCRLLVGAAILLVALAACRKVPKDVIGKDEMVSLLIDIHKGEGLVDIQHTKFYNDSLRKTLKQSILLKHGVTQAQLDTSFVWYGNHIEDYIEIYDEVIKELEAEVKAPNKSAAVVYAVGDSIDVWTGSQTYRIDSRLTIKNLTFNYAQDDTWKPGDNYTLQFKIFNQRGDGEKVKATLFARYDDGEIEFRQGSATSEGWTRIRLVTDSTRMPGQIFGSLIFNTLPGETLYLDSVALVRTRNIPETYSQRYSQRHLAMPPEKVLLEDSTNSNDSIDVNNSAKSDEVPDDSADPAKPSSEGRKSSAVTSQSTTAKTQSTASQPTYRPGYNSPSQQNVIQQSQVKVN